MNEPTVDQHLAWYLARGSGIVALVLLVASLVWGVLLASRVLRPHDRPAWLLDLHRWLGACAVATTLVHLLGLWLDGYLDFGPRELLVPGASPYRPLAVGLGVIALYLLVAVEVTSLLRRRLTPRMWRTVHLLSYATAWLAVVHGALAGTDASATAYRVVAVGVTVLGVAATMVRVTQRPDRAVKRAPGGRPTRSATPAR